MLELGQLMFIGYYLELAPAARQKKAITNLDQPPHVIFCYFGYIKTCDPINIVLYFFLPQFFLPKRFYLLKRIYRFMKL